MAEKLLSYREAAEALGIKPDTLQRWVADFKVPYVRLGRFVRFRPSHIDEIIADREVRPVTRRRRTPRT